MSKGTFKIIVKSANLSKIQGAPQNMEPFAQIVFGEQVRRTKVCEGGGLNPVWNESFTFKKKDEYRLGIQIFKADTGSRDDLVGMQEVGINSFIKKKSVVDHPVELMNDGAIIGEILLNIEYIPEPGPSLSWQNTNQKQKQYGVHKLMITKLKANLEFENANLPSPPTITNLTPILKITMGKKTWKTSASASAGKNLKWSESFNLVIDSEKELSLEIIEGEQMAEERFGSAVIKLKSISQGSSGNKIPIILDGQQVGFLFFQTEYQVPVVPSAISLEDSSLANVGRLGSPYLIKNGKLVVSTIRVYLEKNFQVEEPYVLILWGSQIEKSSVLQGQTTSKPEWKELIVFTNTNFENRIEVKLLDKNSKTEDDVVGYGYLLLESTTSEGGKYRSQKIELFNEEKLQGQMYIDFEYKLDNQGQKDLAKYDPLDMKKKSKPTAEEIRKREILEKRRNIMKQSVMSTERNKSFLPSLDENSNIFRLKTPAIRHSPQPKTALKAVHQISLPQLNYQIRVNEYNKLYKDSVFGLGMSNIHSAQSLRHSIPSFSVSKADRFPQKKYDGFDSFNYIAASNFTGKGGDNYKFTKDKIFTPDQKYEIFHKSPTQKPGVSFGVGRRFENKIDSSPGYYQGPQLLNYND